MRIVGKLKQSGEFWLLTMTRLDTGISPEMAVRLSIAFDTSAASWLHQQAQYDLWHVEQRRGELKVQKLSAA